MPVRFMTDGYALAPLPHPLQQGNGEIRVSLRTGRIDHSSRHLPAGSGLSARRRWKLVFGADAVDPSVDIVRIDTQTGFDLRVRLSDHRTFPRKLTLPIGWGLSATSVAWLEIQRVHRHVIIHQVTGRQRMQPGRVTSRSPQSSYSRTPARCRPTTLRHHSHQRQPDILLCDRRHARFRSRHVIQFRDLHTPLERRVRVEFMHQRGQPPGEALRLPHPPQRDV